MEGEAARALPPNQQPTGQHSPAAVSPRHSLAYHIKAGAACALVYLAVSWASQFIPVVVEYGILRPSYAIGPITGLFFGWPAIIGCTLANAAYNIAYGSEVSTLYFVAHTLLQTLYNALPYLLWYLIYRKSPRPYPRIDSSGKAAWAMALFVLTTLVFEIGSMIIESAVLGILSAEYLSNVFFWYLIRLLGDMVVLVFLGLPLLIMLERSPLTPTTPRAIKVAYQHHPRIKLTQLAVVALLFAVLIMLGLFSAVAYAENFIAEELTEDYVLEIVTSIYLSVGVSSIIAFPCVLAAIRYVEQRLTHPIEMLTEASSGFVAQLRAYQEGNAAEHGLDAQALAPLLDSQSEQKSAKLAGEMAELVSSTDAMRHSIVTYLNELENVTAERERTAAELDIASRIQVDAVPHDFSTLNKRYHLNIAGMLKPAREVGGDFYDAFDIGEGRVGFIIADVSGKGVPAALFMMRALAEIREQMRFCDDVGEALTCANKTLCERNDAMLFVTALACVLDVRSGELTFANAGHNPPWLVHAQGLDACRQGFMEARPGLVMGVMDTVRYKSRSFTLLPGDCLLFYTDGVTEAMNKRDELFGNDRLEAALRDAFGHNERPTSEVIEHVLHTVEEFAADAPQADDITMLACRWDAPIEVCAFKPQDAELDRLLGFVEQICSEANASTRMIFELKLVLEELFVNIAHYGFPEGTEEKPVIVQAALLQDAQVLHLAMSDAGVAYNPLAYEPQLVSGELGAQNKVGGLGIHLVRTCTDHLSYERTEGRNILQFTKNIC